MAVRLQFIACTAVIVYSGAKLSLYGDVIAEKTSMGRTWVGVALMASVTSLPELGTGVSSVALFDLPNIAAGEVPGSCMSNILVIAMLDPSGGTTPISARAHQGQVLTAGFGILLLGLAGIGIAAREHIPRLGWLGLSSLVFIGAYLVAMRTVFLFEKRRLAEYAREVVEEARYARVPKGRAYALYGVNAAVIIAAATLLMDVAV